MLQKILREVGEVPVEMTSVGIKPQTGASRKMQMNVQQGVGLRVDLRISLMVGASNMGVLHGVVEPAKMRAKTLVGTLVLVMQNRILVGLRKMIQTLDLVMQPKILVGGREVTGAQDLQMQIRNQNVVRKAAGVLVPMMLAKTLVGAKGAVGTLLLVVQTRMVGLRKMILTLDLVMQPMILVGGKRDQQMQVRTLTGVRKIGALEMMLAKTLVGAKKD